MKPALRLVLLGLGVIGVMVLYYLKTNHIVFAEHERFERNLRMIESFDATLNQNALKARFRLLVNYDDFPDQIAGMKQAIGGLAVAPSFLSRDAQQGIHQSADRADPLGHGCSVEFDSLAGINLALTIQRDVITKLRDQHMSQQTRTCIAALDRS